MQLARAHTCSGLYAQPCGRGMATAPMLLELGAWSPSLGIHRLAEVGSFPLRSLVHFYLLGVCGSRRLRPHSLALRESGQNRADNVDDHLRARDHSPPAPRARPQPPTPSALRLQCLCAGLSPTLGLYPCPYPSSIGHAMRWYGGVSVVPARLWRAYTSRVPLWQHTLQWP